MNDCIVLLHSSDRCSACSVLCSEFCSCCHGRDRTVRLHQFQMQSINAVTSLPAVMAAFLLTWAADASHYGGSTISWKYNSGGKVSFDILGLLVTSSATICKELDVYGSDCNHSIIWTASEFGVGN